jgi:hypothetical protein
MFVGKLTGAMHRARLGSYRRRSVGPVRPATVDLKRIENSIRSPLDNLEVYVYYVRTVPRSRANARLPTETVNGRKTIAGLSSETRSPRDESGNRGRCGAFHGGVVGRGERVRQSLSGL